MTAEQFIKAQLAALAHREAAHLGGIDNMAAVVFVMRNRQRAGWFGGDWMAIIQNTAAASAVIYPESAPNLRDVNFRLLLQMIDDIYSGMAPDRMTMGALYYCELNRVENAWFRDNVVRDPENHPRVANVGQVAFFK